MRSKHQDPNIRKVAIILIILAVAWLVVGTLFLLKFKDTIINGTYSANGQNVQTEEKEDTDTSDDIEEPVEEPDDTYADDSDDDDIDDSDDAGVDDTDGVSSAGNSDSSLDSADDDDEDFDDDDSDADDNDNDADDEDDEDDNAATFTVDAWDGFAAVRTGRGTGYQQVGKLNNGAKVKVTDLENGWYKIASGKWKGYYLHKSSLK